MATVCARPCPEISHQTNNPNALRQHLLTGACCMTAWLALADQVLTLQQRLDCLTRAAAIAPEDLDLQIELLNCHAALSPDNQEIAAQLRQTRALRVVRNVRPYALRRREPARSIGRILLTLGALNDMDLHKLLAEQRRYRDQQQRVLLGELIIRHNLVPPAALARALMIQYHERQDYGSPAALLGEILVQDGYISLRQLELALTDQLRLLQLNQRDSLGKILMRRSVISWPILQQAIERQHQIALASYI